MIGLHLLGSKTQDQNPLVLDIEMDIGVVGKLLFIRQHDSISGKHNLTLELTAF